MTGSMRKIVSLLILFLLIVVAGWGISAQEKNRIPEEIADIFRQNCSTAGCHSGMYAASGLNLEKDRIVDSLVNVNSVSAPEFKRVNKENPKDSYLLMKIKGAERIKGGRMPLGKRPLDEYKIRSIEEWIMSLEGGTGSGNSQPFRKPPFWGTRLINLPTTRTAGKGKGLFRISHRFFPRVIDGYDAFFGLDGPAVIQLYFGYGVSRNLDIFLSRTNRYKEVEVGTKWAFLRPGSADAVPFSVALTVSGSLATESLPERAVFSSRNMKFNALLSFAYQVNNRLSFLLSPGFSTNANHWESSSESILSLGFGARYMILDDLSLILEWIPLRTGYTQENPGWGLGIEKKIGGHVFQIYALNTIGITPAQYLPGSALARSTDFRLGFSIFRWF